MASTLKTGGIHEANNSSGSRTDHHASMLPNNGTERQHTDNRSMVKHNMLQPKWRSTPILKRTDRNAFAQHNNIDELSPIGETLVS